MVQKYELKATNLFVAKVDCGAIIKSSQLWDCNILIVDIHVGFKRTYVEQILSTDQSNPRKGPKFPPEHL